MNLRNITLRFAQRTLFTFSIVMLSAFSTGDGKSEYILPLRASSVCTADIDLDGDMDIVVGHEYSSLSEWGGLSILANDGTGHFDLTDSLYFEYGFPFVNIGTFDDNNFPDIFSIHITTNPYTVYAGIIYNYAESQFDSIKSFFISNIMADRITSGDINGDGFTDIVFAYNVEQQWGVIYNDGTGNFGEPEFYNTDLNPNELAVGDIDGNGRDDIAIAGSDTEIWYSFETGFETFYFSGYEHSINLKDMDNDGDLDVITIWGAFVTTYIIYENQGYQNFQQHIIYSFEGVSGGLRTPYINTDSLPEITFMDGSNYYIMYNNGQFNFTEPDIIEPNDFEGPQNNKWADIDNNGFQDIIIDRCLGIYLPNLKILFNDGNGNFGEDPITNIQHSTFNNQYLKCYPNPFTTGTTIEINIKENEFAELLVYNLSGKKVKTLTHKTTKGGIIKIKWDGLDNGGKPCKPGPYLLTLEVNGNVMQTIKLMKY